MRMKKWRPFLFSTFSAVILLIIGTFIFYPERFFPDASLTYAESIKTNWGLTIPDPDQETTIKNERFAHGDGETITELYYEKSTDLQSIKNLSNSWMTGKEFEEKKKDLPPWIDDLIKEVNSETSYFYFKKDHNDYLILELRGNNVTVYESYI